MPFSDVDPDKPKLTDRLSYRRTTLANERTLLSYVRTGITLLAGGGTLIKFLGEVHVLFITGIALVVLGGVTLVVGTWRFIAVARELRQICKEPPEKEKENQDRQS